MIWVGVGVGMALLISLVLFLLRKRKSYSIVPLDEPLTSRYTRKRCVYYRVQVARVMRDGSREILYEEEKGINFIVLDRNGLPVEVELKPRKVYERFVRARHLSPDPFAYMCRERPLVLDDTLGVVIREWVIEAG